MSDNKLIRNRDTKSHSEWWDEVLRAAGSAPKLTYELRDFVAELASDDEVITVNESPLVKTIRAAAAEAEKAPAYVRMQPLTREDVE